MAPGINQVPRKKITKLQHPYEFMEETSTAEMRQTRMVPDDL
jgi:hypothetical protein